MITLAHVLESAASDPRAGFRFVDRRENERFYSFNDVWNGARRTASFLRENVAHKARVALILPTCEEFLDVVFGCHLARAVPVPMYPPVRLARLDEYLDRTRAMLQLCEAEIVITDRRVMRVVGARLQAAVPNARFIEVSKIAGSNKSTPELAMVEPDDPALIQFTSGSTQVPRGVELTHRQILANIKAFTDKFPEPSAERLEGVCWLPLYHDMGLIGCVFGSVFVDCNLTLIPPELFLARPALWLRAISRHRATISPAPNFAYGLCLDKVADDEMHDVDLSSWELALNGAEPIAPAGLERFSERFANWGLRPEALTPVYGLAEASLAVTFSEYTERFLVQTYDREEMASGRAVRGGQMQLVSVGKPLDGYQVEIRDARGGVCGERLVGRIWARGPSLMSGYVGGAIPPTTDGWLDTGDLGFLDEGELYISGRAKDLVIHRGQNRSAYEIEHPLNDVRGVRPGCVVAVSDIDEGGDRTLIFVEARDARPGLADDCRKAIRSHAGVDVSQVVVLKPGTLPRTTSGKLRRSDTLEKWKRGTLTAARKSSRLSVFWEVLRDKRSRWLEKGRSTLSSR